MGLPGLEGFPGIKVSTGVRNASADSTFRNVYWAPTVVPGTVLSLEIHEGKKQIKISALMELTFQEENTEAKWINTNN